MVFIPDSWMLSWGRFVCLNSHGWKKLELRESGLDMRIEEKLIFMM